MIRAPGFIRMAGALVLASAAVALPLAGCDSCRSRAKAAADDAATTDDVPTATTVVREVAPPPSTPPTLSTPVEIIPMPSGSYSIDLNLLRIRQCCIGLLAKQRSLTGKPEMRDYIEMTNQCYKAQPNSPELTTLHTLMKGKAIPPQCQGI